MEKWGPWEWLQYGCIAVASLMLAYEAAHSASPVIAENLPSLSQNWLGFAPLVLLLASGTIFLLQRLGKFPSSLGSRFREWPEPYNPIVVAGKTFRNERVPLDGHSYRSCTFEHVTFVYNGTTAIQLSSCNIGKPFVLHTDNPAIMGTIVWLKAFNLLSSELQIELPPGAVLVPITPRAEPPSSVH